MPTGIVARGASSLGSSNTRDAALALPSRMRLRSEKISRAIVLSPQSDNFKSLLFTDLSTTVIRLSFRDKIAWLFESELPEEKAKRAKTEATQGDGSSGGSSSSSSSSSSSRSYSRFRYHGRQSDKEKGADSTIPQLLENYYSTYDTYFETKGILKLLMAEYLRTHNVRLKKERSRNRFIPNGRSYSKYGRGVAGAARLIKALGDDYGR